MVPTAACTRCTVRALGVCMGAQLRHGSETFQCLPLGLQQTEVELFRSDHFAVFPGVVCCKCVSRISFGISADAFQRYEWHGMERFLTPRTRANISRGNDVG